MSDSRDVAYAAGFLGFGAWSFFKGFKYLRRRRLIENTPTSTVRGMALGLVELYGKAAASTPLKSPITKADCALYQYLVEELRRSKNSSYWAKIASGNSFYCPFWLEDATGKIMVFPQKAELVLVNYDYRFTAGFGQSWPKEVIEFAQDNGISYQTWLGKRELRFTEWYVRQGEPIYVLGTAGKAEHDDSNYREKLMRGIQKLKEDPERMKEVDTNKDGRISEDEWDNAVHKIEMELMQQVSSDTQAGEPTDVIITKGEEETTYIISDQSEKDLVKSFSWKCFWGIYGGAALSLAMLAYLAFRFRYICRF